MSQCPRCGEEMVEGVHLDPEVIPPVTPAALASQLKVVFFSCEQCGYVQMRPKGEPPSKLSPAG